MTKSKKDTKIDFSAAFNTFLIDLGSPIKVRCLCCKNWCKQIELPHFTMYFCTSLYCQNVLELRQMECGDWELHDYGAFVQVLTEKKIPSQLLVKPREKFVPVVVK